MSLTKTDLKQIEKVVKSIIDPAIKSSEKRLAGSIEISEKSLIESIESSEKSLTESIDELRQETAKEFFNISKRFDRVDKDIKDLKSHQILHDFKMTELACPV